MPFAIIYFLFQLALAIATVVVVSRLYLAIKRTGAKGETLALIGAAMVASLVLSARGLFVASTTIQAETPLPIDLSDWLLVITGAITLRLFAAYGNVLVSRIELEQSVKDLSATDALTGVFNKGAFMTMSSPLVQTALRYKHPLTALMVDIDHFTRINDEFGRSAGDEALKVFGGVVGACLRKIDILGRMGGEKFAIVLPHTDVKGATIVAERVCAAINRNIKLTFDKKNVRLTASVGVAALHDGNLENLLSVADGAMYSAKRAGRNQVVVESADVY
jgi:diguanylate cyclase (GGDEF)-like protein